MLDRASQCDTAVFASHIHVAGADFVPSDNGAHWTLCSGAGCTGPSGSTPFAHTPGVDQANESTRGGAGNTGTSDLGGSPVCDDAFDGSGGCTAAAGASQSEFIRMEGPTTSTDTSTSFTTTITWSAVP